MTLQSSAITRQNILNGIKSAPIYRAQTIGQSQVYRIGWMDGFWSKPEPNPDSLLIEESELAEYRRGRLAGITAKNSTDG